MASSDDFKALLKAGNITEALALALSEAVELKFTTWVPSEDDAETTPAQPGHRLRTRINMIEGEVEHEIGEEFIGTGRYRDLKQLHLDQVAEGSKLIQNNLKSLQKLIEVLVALRYPQTKTPVIEPESRDTESQLLPPGEEGKTGLVVESQDAIETAAVVSPEIVPDEEWVVEPEETANDEVEPLVDSDDSDLSATENLTSLVSTPSSHSTPVLEEEMDQEDEDDWDDPVLDLLESLPVEPPPNPETSDWDMRESLEWQELVEEESTLEPQESEILANQAWENLPQEDFESPPVTEAPTLEEKTAPVSEDLRDFVEEESLSESEAETFDSLDNQELDLSPVTEAPILEEITAPVNEDLRDFVEEESTLEPEELEFQENQDWENFSLEESPLHPVTQPQNLEDITPQIDEDWGDLVGEEPESHLTKPIPNLENLDLEEDEEWDDWVMEEPEPIFETPLVDMDALDMGEEEDWGDLVEEDPFATVPPPDKSVSSWESEEDWGDFTDEELQPPPGALGINSDTSDTDSDFDLFEALDDLTPIESELTDQSAGDAAVSPESDALEELDAPDNTQSKPGGKRVPPPPPPGRSPHQNN